MSTTGFVEHQEQREWREKDERPEERSRDAMQPNRMISEKQDEM